MILNLAQNEPNHGGEDVFCSFQGAKVNANLTMFLAFFANGIFAMLINLNLAQDEPNCG